VHTNNTYSRTQLNFLGQDYQKNAKKKSNLASVLLILFPFCRIAGFGSAAIERDCRDEERVADQRLQGDCPAYSHLERPQGKATNAQAQSWIQGTGRKSKIIITDNFLRKLCFLNPTYVQFLKYICLKICN
jgi:hypothetical protein